MKRAEVLKFQGMLDQALSDIDKAIQLAPGYSSLHYHRAETWYAKSEYQKAIEDYTEAIRLTPNYANAYYDEAPPGERVASSRKRLAISPRQLSSFPRSQWAI